MVTSRVENESYLHLDNDFFNEELNKVICSILPQFDKMAKAYLTFNLVFLLLAFVEAVTFIVFFATLAQSSLLAFSLAVIFLTIFSYFILRMYLQAKRPEQFINFRDRYLRGCKNLINYREGIPEHHIALAHACNKLATKLEGREYLYYHPPQILDAVAPSVEKFSCWWFWEDLLQMRELLLNGSIEEHLKLVKCEPTSLDIHAALANAYVILSSLYLDPAKRGRESDDRWVPEDRYTAEMEKKFRETAERAIEEFEILNDYAPNDPWVHMQLAYSYHDLQMPKEEIREYEHIRRLRPDDKEVLFKLGCLYFQQGFNAEGLKIYEELKRSHYAKAEALIAHYGNE
ncbi:MAG: hypothetical protein H7A37_03755 [Chlamydiales bacterium]|nr:hypothetical protein [Chlamydiia bacterium]MCP5507401.1 hypothetical protein [Chlamydiales bacterium]